VIVSEFQVTPQEARQDVQVFLQELADARMVEFREQPVASQDSANHDAY
jgi:hypothetical protein